MAVLTGLLAVVDSIKSSRGWEISPKSDVPEGYAANTHGLPFRVAGIKDWNGNVSCWGAIPPKLPGDSFTFKGSITGAAGVAGTAIVDSVEIDIDLEKAAPISHQINFSGDGALDLADTSSVTDTTEPDPYPSIGCKVQLGTVASPVVYSDLDGVRNIKIKMSAKNQAYSHVGTAGWTKRTKGPMDIEVALGFYPSSLSTMPQLNEIKAMKVFIDATYAWLFQWMIMADPSGIKADRETAAIIACTLNWKFSSHALIGTTNTIGSVALPVLAGTTLWPTDARA